MTAIGIGISPVFGSAAGAGGAAVPYFERVLATQPANLIALWRLNETSGTVADNAEGTAARDGAYTGVTLGQPGIGDGGTAPLFDGINDYCNIYSSSLSSAMNWAAGTVFIWMRVAGAGVWTDGTSRHVITLTTAGSNDRAWIYIPATDGIITVNLRLGGTSEFVNIATTSTDWMCVVLAWDKAADEAKVYVNGSQSGTTQGTLGTPSGGGLLSTGANIGASTTAPSLLFSGWLAHGAVWSTALSAPEIAALATV